MVGEIRDKETARVSIQSALTGHLVLTTLHTNDSVSAITRIIDIGIEPYLVSSAIKGIVAQRLVRKVCNYCQETYLPSREEKDIITESLNISSNDLKLRRGKGCEKCKNTGYLGRTAIYEILLIDDKIQKAITQEKDETFIKKVALKNGMKTLKQEGIQKALHGVTTVDEVLRVTFI
jgi:general secretion pathway protein E